MIPGRDDQWNDRWQRRFDDTGRGDEERRGQQRVIDREITGPHVRVRQGWVSAQVKSPGGQASARSMEELLQFHADSLFVECSLLDATFDRLADLAPGMFLDEQHDAQELPRPLISEPVFEFATH